MCNSTNQSQRFDHFAIEPVERFGFGRVSRKRACSENASVMRSVERRRAVGMGFGEDHLAFGNDAVNVKNVPSDKLLEQVIRLRVAELIEVGPQFVRLVDFFHSDAGRLRARLQQPGRLYPRHKIVQRLMIQDVDEFRHGHAGLLRLSAHREFVAEIPNRRQTHPRNAQVFAQVSGIFEIEFIERHNAVDRLPARQITDGVNDRLHRQFFGHEEKFVDGFARPIAVPQFFDGQQQHAAAQLLTGAQEFLAFFVRGDAEDGDGPRLGQETSEQMFCHESRVDAR